jgi:hypothetical protein
MARETGRITKGEDGIIGNHKGDGIIDNHKGDGIRIAVIISSNSQDGVKVVVINSRCINNREDGIRIAIISRCGSNRMNNHNNSGNQ